MGKTVNVPHFNREWSSSHLVREMNQNPASFSDIIISNITEESDFENFTISISL